MDNQRQHAIKGIRTGDSWTITRTFTREEVLAFGEISRDYNPVHYDVRFARSKGFKDVVCHGLLTASMISQVGGQLGWLAASMQFDFKKPVYMGDTITTTLTVGEISDKGFAQASAVYCNQDDEVVITAQLTGILPTESDKKVLQAMVDEGDPTNKLNQ